MESIGTKRLRWGGWNIIPVEMVGKNYEIKIKSLNYDLKNSENYEKIIGLNLIICCALYLDIGLSFEKLKKRTKN